MDDVCFTMHAQTEGADTKFLQKLDSTIVQHKHFEGLQTHFKIHHYAGTVDYDCDGFTESNKDTLFKDLIQLMQTSTKYLNNTILRLICRNFIQNLFQDTIEDDSRKRPTTALFKIKVRIIVYLIK